MIAAISYGRRLVHTRANGQNSDGRQLVDAMRLQPVSGPDALDGAQRQAHRLCHGAAGPVRDGTSLSPNTTYVIEATGLGNSAAELINENADAGTGDVGNSNLNFSFDGSGGSAANFEDGAKIASVIETVCFVAGTRIKIKRGDVAVEQLAVGDIAITSSGACRPIRWLGHRTVNCRSHASWLSVMPIRIAANAFGENRPARDLLVSPGHAIRVDSLGEVLIPAGALVNGSTVQQVEVESVTYWHVELDDHDILLAENLACERYLEMGNRDFFAEEGIVSLAAAPDAKMVTHADFCRPFVNGGPMLDAVKARLGERAAALLTASGATEMFRSSAGRRARGR